MNIRSIMSHMAALGLLFSTLLCPAEAAEKKVFAFCGESSRLMENGLSSFVLAATMQSDYIAMEFGMTRDNHRIVFRDIDLTGSTDVAKIDAFVTDSVDTTPAFLNSREKDQEQVVTGQQEPLFTPLPIKE